MYILACKRKGRKGNKPVRVLCLVSFLFSLACLIRSSEARHNRLSAAELSRADDMTRQSGSPRLVLFRTIWYKHWPPPSAATEPGAAALPCRATNDQPMKFMTTRKRRRQEKTYSPKARSAPLPDSDETCSRRDTVHARVEGWVGRYVMVRGKTKPFAAGNRSIDPFIGRSNPCSKPGRQAARRTDP